RRHHPRRALLRRGPRTRARAAGLHPLPGQTLGHRSGLRRKTRADLSAAWIRRARSLIDHNHFPNLRGSAPPRFYFISRRTKMPFLAKLLQGIAFIPAIVHGIEALFGHNSSSDKKD